MQDDPDPKTSLDQATRELSRGFENEKSGARRVVNDAKDAITQKADDLTSEAKDALLEQTEGATKDIGASLQAFGGALRAASDHLANSDQRAAANMVLEAAGGLERLSTSLKTKPIEEVLGELRSFGRDNSTALMAGSVMAGLALGRFIKSSGSSRSSGGQPGSSSGGSRHPSADFASFDRDQPEFPQEEFEDSAPDREGLAP